MKTLFGEFLLPRKQRPDKIGTEVHGSQNVTGN